MNGCPWRDPTVAWKRIQGINHIGSLVCVQENITADDYWEPTIPMALTEFSTFTFRDGVSANVVQGREEKARVFYF